VIAPPKRFSRRVETDTIAHPKTKTPKRNPMRPLAAISTLTLMTLLLQACSGFHFPKLGLPRVHKITIQQGNVITQEMIDRLKPGMTRSQVVFVMGNPVLQNPFNKDRWDYLYLLQIPDGGSIEQTVSLYFKNERLSHFTGDLAPSSQSKKDEETEEKEPATQEMGSG